MKKRITYLILGMLVLLNSIVVYAGNNDVNALREKKSKTDSEIKSIQKEIHKKQLKEAEVTNEINALDRKIDEADNELAKVENKLKTINGNIKKTKEELVEAENNITKKNDTLNSRLRVMYKNGSVGYLEVLLDSEDIGDLLTRLDMVKSVVSHDVDLLKYMKEQREIIVSKKKDLEIQQDALASTRVELNNKKQDLVVATRAKERLMADIKQDKDKLEKQEDELNALAEKISSEIRKRQLSVEYAGGEMMWPTPGIYRITSPYGYRIHPILHTRKMHTGVDIGASYGTKVLAANDGVVQMSGWLGGYGKVVLIDHGGGITTLYAHNSRLLVKAGAKVKRGQAISKVGSTGNSTGAHLHFEVRKNGSHVNPLPWVKGK